MRLVLHNPHTEVHFGITLLNFITRSPSFRKYQFLINYCIANNKNLVFYIDGKDSSFPLYIGKYIPQKIEIILWCLINQISPFKVKIEYDMSNLRNDDIFFSFTYKYMDQIPSPIQEIADRKFIKIFHLTHFVMNTSIIVKNWDTLKVDFFTAENNLSKHSNFFRKMFPGYGKDIYTLPYTFQMRFQNVKPFSIRRNKCIATGTTFNIEETFKGKTTFKDFQDFYQVNHIHPLRREIFQNEDKIKSNIDSYINNLWDKKRKETGSADTVFKKIYNKYFNAFVLARREYFQFNIVEKYNEYKMFIAPEEINDLPGVGFVEGMACGSCYLGLDSEMYRDLGLVPNQHYIAHNGTLEDVLEKVSYYQHHQDELEKIAQSGYEFITSKLSGEAVASTFWNDLENLSKEYKKSNYDKSSLHFDCSFVQS